MLGAIIENVVARAAWRRVIVRDGKSSVSRLRNIMFLENEEGRHGRISYETKPQDRKFGPFE
jgi:hypothetical protein